MRSIIKKKTRTGKSPLYFAKRHKSFEKRNSMILEGLPKPGSWILDVGSNTGETSNDMADAGHVAIGLEKMAPERKIALEGSRGLSGFLCTDVTGDFILGGVDWDAILLLSVLHRVFAFEGEDQMKSVLSACGQKTKKLFIEGSTRHARYNDQGQASPSFTDLDVESAKAWHSDLFKEVLGESWSVRKDVALECSKNEPFRLFYELERA
ncbi:MAG: hypothetical protein AAGA47_12580 [Pseudomonadota bacterium]